MWKLGPSTVLSLGRLWVRASVFLCVVLAQHYAQAFRADHRWISRADAPRLLKEYRDAAKNDRNNFTAMTLFAEALLKMGKLKKAYKALNRAAALAPDERNSRIAENLYQLAYQYNKMYNSTLKHELPRYRARARRREQANIWLLAENEAADKATRHRPADHGVVRKYAPEVVRQWPSSEITLKNTGDASRDEFYKFVSEDFESKYWERAPVLIHAPGAFDSILSLDEVLDDKYMYKGNKRERKFPQNVKYIKVHFADVDKAPEGLQTRPELTKALIDGHTLQFLGIHFWSPKVARFAIDLSRASGRQTSINLYITPPGVTTSLSPHTDYQGSFMVQLHGRKRWRLWQYPDLQLPVRARHVRGRDDGDELNVEELSPPYLDVVVSAGDILFVPRGCLHATSTPKQGGEGETAKEGNGGPHTASFGDIAKDVSMHMTVGQEVMADVTGCFTWESFFGAGAFFRHEHVFEGYFQALRQLMDKDVRFRQGLPSSMIKNEEDDKVDWKEMARSMMHTVVDEMFSQTDFAEETQRYVQRNYLNSIVELYDKAQLLKLPKSVRKGEKSEL